MGRAVEDRNARRDARHCVGRVRCIPLGLCGVWRTHPFESSYLVEHRRHKECSGDTPAGGLIRSGADCSNATRHRVRRLTDRRPCELGEELHRVSALWKRHIEARVRTAACAEHVNGHASNLHHARPEEVLGHKGQGGASAERNPARPHQVRARAAVRIGDGVRRGVVVVVELGPCIEHERERHPRLVGVPALLLEGDARREELCGGGCGCDGAAQRGYAALHRELCTATDAAKRRPAHCELEGVRVSRAK